MAVSRYHNGPIVEDKSRVISGEDYEIVDDMVKFNDGHSRKLTKEDERQLKEHDNEVSRLLDDWGRQHSNSMSIWSQQFGHYMKNKLYNDPGIIAPYPNLVPVPQLPELPDLPR